MASQKIKAKEPHESDQPVRNIASSWDILKLPIGKCPDINLEQKVMSSRPFQIVSVDEYLPDNKKDALKFI